MDYVTLVAVQNGGKDRMNNFSRIIFREETVVHNQIK
jgi:hypothetical protein